MQPPEIFDLPHSTLQKKLKMKLKQSAQNFHQSPFENQHHPDVLSDPQIFSKAKANLNFRHRRKHVRTHAKPAVGEARLYLVRHRENPNQKQ